MVIEDRWLSVEEICKYLGVSNDTVYKWIDKQNMPAHRMGRLWKFRKEEGISRSGQKICFRMSHDGEEFALTSPSTSKWGYPKHQQSF